MGTMTDNLLRVMTWNLRDGGVEPDGSYRRWERQAARIAQVAPDVLLLQECKGWDARGAEQLYRAEAGTGMRGFLAPARMTGSHLAAFIGDRVRAVRFDHGHEAVSWHAQCALRLRVSGHEAELVVVNVHLSPFSEEHRLTEAGLLTRFAADGVRSVVAGDFNSVPWGDPEPVLAGPEAGVWAVPAPPGEPTRADRRVSLRLLQAGFADAAAASGAPLRATTDLFRGDLVYVSPLLRDSVVACRTLDDPARPGEPPLSDHLAVVVDLDLDAATTAADDRGA